MESPRTRSDTNRWMMTDPLTFAVLLTVTTLALALGFTDTEPAALFSAWGGALSQLFAFTMQMALIIATAYALAVAGLGIGFWLLLGPGIWVASLGLMALHLGWQSSRVEAGDPAMSLRLFKSNRDAGLILTAGLVVTQFGI